MVAPDGSRSALWDGTSSPTSALVYAGPDCTGEPLFRASFVLATSPEAAALLSSAWGGDAPAGSLGEGGSTGPHVENLYCCGVSPLHP